MILSRGRQYLFVHIPKTGGTAMALALETRAMADDLMLGDTPKARRRRGRLKGASAAGRLWKHSTLADLDGLFSRVELDTLFIFTLVRNPWDRMVSYYHWLRGQNFDHPAVTLSQRLDFNAFATHPQTLHALRAAPARHYMTAADGREHCRAYIRIEHLETDMAPLTAHLGFTPDLPHANASPRRRDYRAYFDAPTASAIHDAAAEDIARFGYSF